MKEIKAYIRCSRVEDVIHALREIGVDNMTVIDVMALGKGLMDPQHFKYSIDCVEKYSEVAKVEITCADRDVKDIVGAIQSECHSGERGDGIVIISDVDQAVKIRTGDTGESFLQPKRIHRLNEEE